jgi:hypothetical protein
MKKILSIILVLFGASKSNAQLIVNSGVPPVTAVQNYFAGNGVTLSNVVFTGSSLSAAAFQSVSSNIGLSSGLILSTGNALDAAGANTNPNTSTALNTAGDADLTTLLGGSIPTFDAASIEFDLVSATDSVFMRFVFASEEYFQVISPNNIDPIGIFISGPGISGTQNLAVIPGTSIPINSQTINSTNYPTKFVDNTNGTTVQYNGFTIPIKAKIKVLPCNIYHIKIAIADAGNKLTDSAILLEAGSLISGPGTPINCVVSPYYSKQDISCQGPYQGSIQLDSISGGIAPYTYKLNGITVTDFPLSNLSAGTYQLVATDNVGGTNTQNITISAPVCQIIATYLTTNTTCSNSPNGIIDLEGVSGGIPPYSYTANGTPITNFPLLGLAHGNYTIIATDAVGNSFPQIVTISSPTAIVIGSDPIGAVCENSVFNANITVSGGTEPYTLSWGTPFSDSLSPFSYQFIATAGANYLANVQDANGCVASLSLSPNIQTTGFIEGDIRLNGSNNFLQAGDTLQLTLLRKSLIAQTVWQKKDSLYFTSADANYHFEFANITDNAQYVILAKIRNTTAGQSSFGQSVLPTYSGSKYLWSQSVLTTILGNVCNLHVDNIDLVNSVGQSSGTGAVTGIISLVNIINKTQANNDPIPLIDVVIERDSLPKSGILVPENPIGSNQFPYNFTALPDGNYRVKVQIAGIPMANNYPLFYVSANTITHIDFCADTFAIGIIDTCNNIPNSINEFGQGNPIVYPNPSEGKLRVDLPSTYKGLTTLRIFSVLGITLWQGEVITNQTIEALENKPDGFYFYEIENSGLKSRDRILIKK